MRSVDSTFHAAADLARPPSVGKGALASVIAAVKRIEAAGGKASFLGQTLTIDGGMASQ